MQNKSRVQWSVAVMFVLAFAWSYYHFHTSGVEAPEKLTAFPDQQNVPSITLTNGLERSESRPNDGSKQPESASPAPQSTLSANVDHESSRFRSIQSADDSIAGRWTVQGNPTYAWIIEMSGTTAIMSADDHSEIKFCSGQLVEFNDGNATKYVGTVSGVFRRDPQQMLRQSKVEVEYLSANRLQLRAEYIRWDSRGCEITRTLMTVLLERS